MGPAVSLESGLPVVIVGSVKGSATLVVGAARLGGKTNAALASLVPVVQEPLLSSGSEGRVQGDVVVLGLGGLLQGISSVCLQIRYAGSRALDPLRVKLGILVAHCLQLGHDLVGEARNDGGAAASSSGQSTAISIAVVVPLEARRAHRSGGGHSILLVGGVVHSKSSEQALSHLRHALRSGHLQEQLEVNRVLEQLDQLIGVERVVNRGQEVDI